MVNPFCRMVPENLDHPGRGLQVLPHPVKRLQPHLTHLESYRQVHAHLFPKEPPGLPSAEQVEVREDALLDSEAFFQVRKKQTALIFFCESWPRRIPRNRPGEGRTSLLSGLLHQTSPFPNWQSPVRCQEHCQMEEVPQAFVSVG